jgi:HK97 family phage prohead protease
MANIEKEVRLLTTATELRAAAGAAMQIEGYAAKFGVVSKPIAGQFREVLQRGAFTQALQDMDDEGDDDCRMTFNHDSNQILGRTKNKTLTLSEDERGLKFRCQLNPDNQAHRDLHASIKRGDIDACSFAFGMDPSGQSWSDDYMDPETNSRCTLRTIKSVKSLFDVSVVSSPAYPSTEVNARAAMEQRQIRPVPYTKDEIDAIRAKLMRKVNSTVALAENGMDVDDEVEDDERSLAGAQYVGDEERAARVAKVLDQFKHDTVVKWLRGESPIGSGK